MAKLTFHGGVGMVTGSNFLLEHGNTKVLVDCGLFQGCSACEDENFEEFPYNPSSVDALFVTHAHLDHIGRIPLLVKRGFRGKIISTPPTKDIAELVFKDSISILEEEAHHNRHTPLYDAHDVASVFTLWETTPYHKELVVGELTVVLKDAGHILGSAMIEIREKNSERKLVFTGDLGNIPSPLLNETEVISDATYLVIESVYGDRNHTHIKDRAHRLEDIVENTIRKKGVLMIPAFSIERTQEILFEIEKMVENRRIPSVPVFLDSPLAIKVTEVYKEYEEYFNKKATCKLNSKDGIFKFPGLHFARSKEASKEIARTPNPKIIIAGSGMSTGGRILFHERQYLSDPANTILFVGYQVPGSLGREIKDGARKVEILGKKVLVKAGVENIDAYSAHRDLDGLVDFVVHTADTVEKVFVVMGEPKSSAFLTQRLRDYIGVDALMPQKGETIEINL